jgi:hypothetical protein
MSTGPISELVVPYDPGPLGEKVARRRRLVRTRLVSLGITVAVLLLIYFWRRDDMQLCVSAALYLVAKRRIGRVGSGTAIRIGPPGIQVAGLSASWPEVVAIDTVKPGLGRGPRLRLTTGDGRRGDVPLDQVTVFPATLDSTVRAFSAGRHGVDLSALES